MTDSVCDAIFVAKANGRMVGRKAGNAMDRRLAILEDIVAGRRRVVYNSKLFSEYEQHIKEMRNDIVIEFFRALADFGERAPKSTLSKAQYHRMRKVRWPTHDQHLLAAALHGTNATIYVTENQHATCANAIRREFAVWVSHII